MSSLAELSRSVSEAERLLAKKEAEEDMLKAELTSKRLRLDEATSAVTKLSDGVTLIQKFSDGMQTGIIQRFEDLLTRGVRQIFDKDYAIRIEFQSKGNGVSADFYAILPDGKKVNLAKGEGGGLKDLVGVLQRVLYIILEPSHPAKLLVLDENMKHLDAARAPIAFAFISDLCKELGIQVIWVTHSDAAKGLQEAGSARIIKIGESNADKSDQ